MKQPENKILSALSILVFMFLFSIIPSPLHAQESQTPGLEEYLAMVEKHSKDLKLAKKELDMAKIYHREALATALPKIQLTADYSRNLKENFLYIEFPDLETGEMSNQKFKINYKNDYSLQAVVNQSIFSFKVGAALKAAKQYKQLSNNVYDAAHRVIITTAKKIFYRTLLAKEVWRIHLASEKNAHENYLQLKKKFDHGQVSRFQLLQAEARWQNHLPETTKAHRNYKLALNTFKIMAGIPLQEEIEPDGTLDKVPGLPDRVEDLDMVLKKRPDFNALLWEEKLRATNIKNEKAGLLPSLDLNLIYNFSSMSDKIKFERKNQSYIVNLSLTVPIFAGGYQRAQVAKARLELEKASLRIQNRKDNISRQLRDIYLRLEEASVRIRSAHKTLKTAKKAFEIAEVTAANGLATQLELKDARLVYDQSRLNRFAAVYDYLDAYFDWRQAIGINAGTMVK